MVNTKYPAPGRGAWRLEGGLLPAKPGTTSKVGYYRQAAAGESPIGSGWLREVDTSHSAYVVHLGVKQIQKLVDVDVDGWFGPDTAKAVVAAQKRWKVEADGIVGRATMRAGLSDVISHIAAAHSVPFALLGGLIVTESSLDPAAVGVNGADHGLAQINMYAHGGNLTLEQAMDHEFALHWAAGDMFEEYERWKSVALSESARWDVAIAHHNSPALARAWAQTGTAPVVEGRSIQIADYVARVRSAW